MAPDDSRSYAAEYAAMSEEQKTRIHDMLVEHLRVMKEMTSGVMGSSASPAAPMSMAIGMNTLPEMKGDDATAPSNTTGENLVAASCPQIQRIDKSASVLFNATGRNEVEKDAGPNLTLHGISVIDNVKVLVEDECSGVVSCTDTLTPTRCSTKVPRLDVNGTTPVLVYTFSREFVVDSTKVAATSTNTSAVLVDSSSGMFTRKAPWPPPVHLRRVRLPQGLPRATASSSVSVPVDRLRPRSLPPQPPPGDVRLNASGCSGASKSTLCILPGHDTGIEITKLGTVTINCHAVTLRMQLRRMCRFNTQGDALALPCAVVTWWHKAAMGLRELNLDKYMCLGVTDMELVNVLVASACKWNVAVPADGSVLHETLDKESVIEGSCKLPHTNHVRFLDKTAVVVTAEDNSPWRLCTVMQVEETVDDSAYSENWPVTDIDSATTYNGAPTNCSTEFLNSNITLVYRSTEVAVLTMRCWRTMYRTRELFAARAVQAVLTGLGLNADVMQPASSNQCVQLQMLDNGNNGACSYSQSQFTCFAPPTMVDGIDVLYGVSVTALHESLNAESRNSKGSSTAEQFCIAHLALSLISVDQLRKCMQSAVEIQRVIMRQGSSTITKAGFIWSAKRFWWVKLDAQGIYAQVSLTHLSMGSHVGLVFSLVISQSTLHDMRGLLVQLPETVSDTSWWANDADTSFLHEFSALMHAVQLSSCSSFIVARITVFETNTHHGIQTFARDIINFSFHAKEVGDCHSDKLQFSVGSMQTSWYQSLKNVLESSVYGTTTMKRFSAEEELRPKP